MESDIFEFLDDDGKRVLLLAREEALDRTRLVVAPDNPNPGTPDGLIPFADDSRRALRDCVCNARDEGRTRVGPEHVLLAVLGVDNRRVSAAVTPHIAVADLTRRIREIHNGTT